MNVELVTIGSELLLGFTIDTNAAHLARELAAIGIAVTRRTTVGDGSEEIAGAVGAALERTGAVITTGGLGPTADDLTKPAIAALFGRRLQLDEGILERLEARWRARRLPGELPASNRQQALIPDGARVLENRHGSAPGILLEDERGRWVAMLPGVPREMRGMLADVLLPELRERAARAGTAGVLRSLTLRTAGIAESALADALGDLANGFPEIPLAYLPEVDGVNLRLTMRARDAEEAGHRLADAAMRLRERVGAYIYGEDGADLAAVVLDLLRARSLRLAIGESCTGGLLAARMATIPGASDTFVGAVVAYDNRLKVELLGVEPALIDSHGAVSEPVVRAMASGARARLGADVGIGVTGIAGPSGGTAEKPVGTVWLAVDEGEEATVRRWHFVGNREEIQRRAAQMALEMLRRKLAT